MKYGKDYWYSIESQRIESKLIKDVKEDLAFYILPFFKEIGTKEKLINYLKSNQTKYGYSYRLFIMIAEEAQILFNKLFENSAERQVEQLKDRGKKYKLNLKLFNSTNY